MMERLLVALLLCVAVPVWSQQGCAPSHVDVPKDRVTATANSVANLRQSPESLRAQLSRLLGDAQGQAAKVKPPPNSNKACSPRCRVVARPAHVIVNVVPKKFISDYADAKECEGLLKQT